MPATLIRIKKNSKLVKKIKNICILLTSILLIIIVINPYIGSNDDYAILKFGSMKNKVTKKDSNNKQADLEKVKFYSLTPKNEPIQLVASHAKEINENEIQLNNLFASIDSSDNIDLYSNIAIWKKDKTLELDGDITIEFNENKLKTDHLIFNIFSNKLYTDRIVKLEGKYGKLTANGFNLDRNNNQLDFTGPIKMIVNNL